MYKFNILKYYVKLNFEKNPHQTQGINYLESKEKIKDIKKTLNFFFFMKTSIAYHDSCICEFLSMYR